MFIDFMQLTILFGLGILGTNVLLAILQKGKKKPIMILTIGELLILAGIIYVVLPSKTLSSILWINLIGVLMASMLLWLLGYIQSGQLGTEIKNAKQKKVVNPPKKSMTLAPQLFWLAIVAALLLGGISGITRIVSTESIYAKIPAKTEEQAETLTSTKETPIAIAPDTAKRKMLQKFSVIPNSNMFTLDGITAQTINGEYVYVATLEYNGFWKWFKLKEIPGYFQISATDINAQPEFVNKPLHYTPSAYFNEDAGRKIYAAFPGYGALGTINLEIDEAGNPFYVQTLYKEYGVTGLMHFDHFKTAVLNAETGEVNLYDSEKAPSFIDAPITSAAANRLNEYYGRYSQGWWNQYIFGAKKDVKIPTENGIYASGQITPMLNKDSELMYFTDFTSDDSNQDSVLGYSLINARTGQLTYYRDTDVGIMDSDGAISIASKIYPEKKWKAEMPVLYNIDGVQTWIVSLMDSKGIFKKYVYINAVDNDIVIDADTAQTALDAYRIELATNGSNNQSSDPANMAEKQGTVHRVQLLTGTSQTVISFLLEDDPIIYSVNINNSPYAQFLQVGDQVTFQANVTADMTAASIESLTIEGVPDNQ
ncbi:DNA-binding protein [Enterococcus casseliflavus]